MPTVLAVVLVASCTLVLRQSWEVGLLLPAPASTGIRLLYHDTGSAARPGTSCNLQTGSLPLLGQCLTSYWEQKKLMAPGCEPLAVRRMMDVLAPHVHGQSLAGAGGGGFLYLLTKEPQQKEALEAVLAKTEGLGNYSIHLVEVDTQGLSLKLLGTEASTCCPFP
ncbi:hypothetical protein H8959_019492 [Pygathrix nigripes]